MAENEDLLFIELALKRGLVTQEQVDEILDLQSRLTDMDLPESVAELMIRKRMLPAEVVEELRTRVSPRGDRQQIKGYRLLQRLGRGGMGSVYRAIQLSMGRPVAIKVLKPSLSRDDQQVARLQREAQLVGKLEHPNVVRGLDFGVSSGFHYFVMDYVEGRSVREILEDDGPFSEEEALRVVRLVAEALAAAHEQGIIHRDVKPGNILIAKDGSVKLADYGLAKGPLEDAQLTQSGVTVGTPQYISPEQARGPSDVDIRTDIYSLGATLYHMVTGRPPYEGETLAHLIQQVLYEPYAPPRTLRRDLSPDTAYLIGKMMARRPRHRYQTPRELLADLDAVEKRRPIVPRGWQGDFEAYHLRRRLKLALVATVFVLLVGGGLTAWFNYRLERLRRQELERTAAEALEEARAGRNLSAGSLGVLIDRHRALLEDEGFRSTESAAVARQRLAVYEEEQELLQAARDLQKTAREQGRSGDWADGIRELMRYRDSLTEGRGSVARDEIAGWLELLRGLRDEDVREQLAKRRRELLDEQPEEALDKLRSRIDDLEARAFLPDEADREGEILAGVRELVRRLEAGIDGVEGYLAGVRDLLDAPAPRDYRRIVERDLSRAREEFERDAGLGRTLDGLPPEWSVPLRESFDAIERRALEMNRAELAGLRARIPGQVAEGLYGEAVDAVSELADRSLDSVADELATMQNDLVAEQERRETLVRSVWDEFLPAWVELLGKREWPALFARLERLDRELVLVKPNPLGEEIAGAHLVSGLAMELEGRFLRSIDGTSLLNEGLAIGRSRYRPLYDVAVSGDRQRVQYRLEPGGPVYEVRPWEISVEDLARWSGQVDPGNSAHRMLLAIFRFAEVRGEKDDRKLMNELAGLRSEVLAGKARPEHAAVAEEVYRFFEGEREAAQERLGLFDERAREIFELAEQAFAQGRWQEAYDNYQRLLTEEHYRQTDFVKSVLPTIRKNAELAKEKLPGVRLGEHFNARPVHLDGGNLQRDYRVGLRFDWEDPRELGSFEFTPGRIGIVEVQEPFTGPPGPDGPPVEERVLTEHLLRFQDPERLPEDWLDRHPLRLGSPFIYSEEIAISFRVRWERPLALLVSAMGTNVVVLSDTDRRENGRGVHVWQGGDLSRPDLYVPDELRATWIGRNPQVLEGESARTRYFRFEPRRWYRVRFVKGEKRAALHVDGRLVHEVDIEQYGGKGSDDLIVITWTPCEIDELAVEGTLDPGWYKRNVLLGRGDK